VAPALAGEHSKRACRSDKLLREERDRRESILMRKSDGKISLEIPSPRSAREAAFALYATPVGPHARIPRTHRETILEPKNRKPANRGRSTHSPIAEFATQAKAFATLGRK
jgi:hypothetical protein